MKAGLAASCALYMVSNSAVRLNDPASGGWLPVQYANAGSAFTNSHCSVPVPLAAYQSSDVTHLTSYTLGVTFADSSWIGKVHAYARVMNENYRHSGWKDLGVVTGQ